MCPTSSCVECLVAWVVALFWVVAETLGEGTHLKQGSYWEHEHESHTLSLVPSLLSASWLPWGQEPLTDIPTATMTCISTGPESREPENYRLDLLKPWAEWNPPPLAHAKDFVLGVHIAKRMQSSLRSQKHGTWDASRAVIITMRFLHSNPQAFSHQSADDTTQSYPIPIYWESLT